jgi:HSP20 family protein
MSRKWLDNLTEKGKTKTTVLALSLGLALGFTAGHTLHSNAENTSITEVKNEKAVSIPVNSAKSNASDERTSQDRSNHRYNGSISKRSLPSSMFEPWWRTMMHDPDADWVLNHFDLVSPDLDRAWPAMTGMAASSLRIDTDEQGDNIKVTAEVPGIEDKDLDVTVTDDFITIKGEKKDENETTKNAGGKPFQAVERAYGMFERAVKLPCRVESDKAVASLKNGVLTVTVPKSHVAQSQPKKLNIRTQ